MDATTAPTTPPNQSHSLSTMKAIVQHSYGTADVLKLTDVDRPVIGDTEVLIQVRAASVNHADWVYTTGTPLIARLAFGLRAPKEKVRGKDVAGTVEAVGTAVTRFTPGDDVYAELEAGSFAEFARAPEDKVARMPANLTYQQAATVPLAGTTALLGLRDAGNLQPGQRVLINGASGGVGTFAVQIAKALGADVTAVCSPRNADLALSLGADRVLDYTEDDFTEAGERYDLIFDSIGNHPLRRLRRALTTRGTLVLSSGTGGRVLGPMLRILRALTVSPFVTQNLRISTATAESHPLDELTELIESGQVFPVIDRTYPLERTPEAIQYFAEQHARAKIVISVPGAPLRDEAVSQNTSSA